MNPLGELRNIHEDELCTMLEWRNSPGVRKNMYTQQEISLDEHLAWWSEVQRRDDQNYFMYEMNGVALGVVSFNGIDTKNEHSFWAFYASPDAPRGTGTTMEYVALNYAFDELNLHKLSCEVLAYNEAVIKLHKKFGFEVEGGVRGHHKLDGDFVDVCRLGILRAEWLVRRSDMQVKLMKLNRK